MAPPNNAAAFDRTPYHGNMNRAENNTGSPGHGSSKGRSYEQPVQISRVEYESLLSVSRQYTNLRQNLIRGGVDEATLDILSADDEPNSDPAPPAPLEAVDDNAQHVERHNTFGKPMGEETAAGRSNYTHERTASTSNATTSSASGGHGGRHGHGPPGTMSGTNDHFSDDGLDDGDVPPASYDGQGKHEPSEAPSQRFVHDRKCLRTLQLVGLSESTTLADVAAVVRGGQLVELYIRPQDRVGIVSFAREPDAKAFFDHVKRRDLYIKNKRVEVLWSERQFTLLGHVSHKISNGATRNLVIRQCNPRLTEASVREDLDHIFNLIVISVTFADGNCLISTNSVHNALFARSCLLSRLIYRTSRIDWAPDECEQPLERIAPPVKQKMPVQTKKAGFGKASRFQLLNLDDGSNAKSTEDESDDDDDSSDGVHGGGGVSATAR